MSFLPKLLIFLVSVGGSGLILFMSKWGIGTFVDTFHYLYGAKSFSDGIGMMDLPQGADRPFVHFPPLLPIALSALHSLGFDWLRGALYLNAALFGLSAFSCGIILKNMTGSWWYGLLGAVFFLVNPSMIYVHSFLLSEPLFLFLSIWCIFFLARYLCRGEALLLFASGACAGLTYLARYAGVSLMVTGVAAILWLKPGRFSFRLKSALMFCLASGLVIGPLLAKNLWATGNMTARSLSLNTFSDQQYMNLIYTLRHWFGLLEAGFPLYPQQWSVLLMFSFFGLGWFALKKKVPSIGNSLLFQRSIPVFLQIVLLILAVFFFSLTLSMYFFDTDLFTGLASLITGKPSGRISLVIFRIALFISAVSVWILFSIQYGCFKVHSVQQEDRLSQNLGVLMFLFVGIYISTILFSMLFVSARPNFYLRILAPMHMAGVMVVLFIFQKNMALKTPAFFRFFNRVVVSAALFLLMASYFSYTKGWALVAHDRGLGYLDRAMRLSVMDQFVRELPSSARIFSNEPTILYFLTGRETGPIQSLDPEKISPNTYLAVFGKFKLETNYLNLDVDKMEKELSLKLLTADEQGWVYLVNPPRD